MVILSCVPRVVSDSAHTPPQPHPYMSALGIYLFHKYTRGTVLLEYSRFILIYHVYELLYVVPTLCYLHKAMHLCKLEVFVELCSCLKLFVFNNKKAFKYCELLSLLFSLRKAAKLIFNILRR